MPLKSLCMVYRIDVYGIGHAMLESFLARYLGCFLKDFTSEQISAHLLKGSVTLRDVELDLLALQELLVDQIPNALELQQVSCSFISLKVPWKRLRRRPVVLDCLHAFTSFT